MYWETLWKHEMGSADLATMSYRKAKQQIENEGNIIAV